MTTFIRFFLLALPPLLGVTVSFGPAVLFGLVATLLLVGVAVQAHFTRDRLAEPWLFWAAVGQTVVVVTLVDLAVSVWMPGVRSVWGVYLNVLALSPLVLLLPFDQPRNQELGADLGAALRTGLLLTALLAGFGLFREVLGRGTLTLVPGALTWPLPLLKDFPLTIVATGAGGFFAAAAGIWLYRLVRPLWARWFSVADFLSSQPATPPPAQAPAPVVVAPAAAAPAPAPVAKASVVAAEPTGDWGETLTSAVADLASGPGSEKRRLLVIGSGNGELAYYLAMLCLEQAKAERGFAFRIRGVDHFSTRIEAAIKGVYRDHQIEMVPPALRDTWMARGQGEERYQWKVGNEPRLHVQFEVADFQNGQLFSPQPSHLIVLNQGIEYVNDDKKAQLLQLVCQHLTPGGALVVPGPFKRELMPEAMKRTGTTVFRRT